MPYECTSTDLGLLCLVPVFVCGWDRVVIQMFLALLINRTGTGKFSSSSSFSSVLAEFATCAEKSSDGVPNDD